MTQPNITKPSIVQQGEELYLNAAGILRWIYQMDAATLDEMRQNGKPEKAARVERFQERARAAVAAESLMAEPRDLNALLWATFDGAELNRRLGTMGSDAVMWLLDEQIARPS